MSTILGKRKNGNGFFRMTKNGKTIKDFDYAKLKKIVRKFNENIDYNGIGKSDLWKICITNNLV